MATTTNRFVLNFNSDIGRVIRIGIPRACTDKTAAETQANMEAIIANGIIIASNRGTPASIKNASRVETTRRPVE